MHTELPVVSGWISSSEFGTATYPPHGEFRLRQDGHVVFYEATGPFNLQAVQCLAKARDALVSGQRAATLLAAVVHFRHSVVMAPDAFSAWEQGLKQFAAQGVALAGVAWVALPEVEGFQFLLSRYRAIFDAAQIPFAVFTDLPLACDWVRGRLDTHERRDSPPLAHG